MIVAMVGGQTNVKICAKSHNPFCTCSCVCSCPTLRYALKGVVIVTRIILFCDIAGQHANKLRSRRSE